MNNRGPVPSVTDEAAQLPNGRRMIGTSTLEVASVPLLKGTVAAASTSSSWEYSPVSPLSRPLRRPSGRGDA